jgi:signal transduction histidine kinase/ligand-binding sensor domain-containing protein/DNA-binding response OmpR family regulator
MAFFDQEIDGVCSVNSNNMHRRVLQIPGRWAKGVFCLSCVIVAFLNHSTADSQAQDLVFEHYTVEQGLSCNSVYAVLQDRRGFMWFGTVNGLNKYDGYSFTVYREDLLDSTFSKVTNCPQLYEDQSGTLWIVASELTRFNTITGRVMNCPDIRVLGLIEDATGTMWFATAGKGLNKFERTSGTFTHYELSNDSLSCIYADSNESGTIFWIGGAAGVDRFDPANGTFTHVEQGSGLHVTALYKDRTGILWIGTNDELYSFDEAEGTFWRCPIASWRSTEQLWSHVHSFHEDRRGILWIGAGDETFSYDRSTGKFVHYRADVFPLPLSVKATEPVYEDRTGSLWLRKIRRGLSRLDPANNTMVSYVHDRNNPTSLSDNAVNEVYEDRSGALWIATVWGGVNKVDRARKAFTHLTHNPAYPLSLTHNAVFGICEDRSGRLWIATRGGLDLFDRKTGIFRHFRHDPQDPHSLSSNIIHTVIEDHEGTIWIGTEACGLDRLDPVRASGKGTATVRFQHYTHDPVNHRSIGSNHILTLFEDGSGNIWIGTDDAGLDKLNKDSGIFVHYRSDPRDTNSLAWNWVNAICEDSKGRLWVGTAYSRTGALHRFDKATGTFARFKEERGPKGSVHSIFEDRRGTLWIGTTHDLNKFEPSTGAFTHCNASQHDAGNFITGIQEDSSGCLWLETSKGVSKYDPRTGSFRTFDRSDGVPICPTWGNACCKSRTGEMFFGGTNGFVRFHPDSIRDNPYIPPIVITAFKIFDKPVSLDTVISEKSVLLLSYNDNVISFEFVALNYTSPEKNQYAYKLEGFDEDWNYCGTRRYANYTNLDAGSYVFRVKGSNNDGVWNEEGASILMIIAPPWWKTVWAYIGYGCVGLSLLYGLRRYDRKRTLLRHQLEMKDFEAEKLHELDSMKMRFFANISHEFRTPLTLILGPAEKLLAQAERKADKEELSIVRRSAFRLLELINQIMDISKLEAGKMKVQVQSLDLVPFLRGLVLSFAALAERNHIGLTFSPAEESIAGYVDRDKVHKIVTNLLSNAFRFTPEGGKICVRLSASGDDQHSSESTKEFVEIVVSDTGMGVSKNELEKIFDRFYQANDSKLREHTGTGIGLALVKELVEIHRGNISVTSEPGKGSTFRVHLPLGRDHWKDEDMVEVAEGEEEPLVSVSDGPQGTVGVEDQGEKHEREVEKLAGEDLPLILLVEDNAEVLKYLRSNLSGRYRLEEAVDGLVALEASISRLPDLVVSDIMMPRMDGVELCRKLKNDERTSHIPLVLLTARASEEGKLEGLDAGADDYIIKPFDVKELQARIQNLIELRKTLREKYRRHCVLEPRDIPIESMEEKFLRKALEVVEKHLSETDFETATLAREVCMSRMQLNRKLQALTGRSAHQFIRNLRLQRAAKLLGSHWGNVTEVAFEVGFTSLSSFAKAFREEFGVSPSKYWPRDT